MTKSRHHCVATICLVVGLASLVLALALLGPRFVGVTWEVLIPPDALLVWGAGLQLLAVVGLALGITALVRKTQPMRSAVAGVVMSTAVIGLVVAAHVGSW